MSDLDDLCDKVNINRIKYASKKYAHNTGSGLKHQFKVGLTQNGSHAQVIYTLTKSNGTCTAHLQTFDENGNIRRVK